MTTKFNETMWFTMRPDMYGGENCDEMVPNWHCYAAGDKDADDQTTPLILDPSSFPPGTKITVEEPACPQCGETRHIDPRPTPPRFDSKCECGFDWDAWVQNEFS